MAHDLSRNLDNHSWVSSRCSRCKRCRCCPARGRGPLLQHDVVPASASTISVPMLGRCDRMSQCLADGESLPGAPPWVQLAPGNARLALIFLLSLLLFAAPALERSASRYCSSMSLSLSFVWLCLLLPHLRDLQENILLLAFCKPWLQTTGLARWRIQIGRAHV